MVYLKWWAGEGFGRGKEKVEDRRKDGLELDRDGWEPLWCSTLVFLHPAGWVPGTTLRDLKGITKVLGMVKWLRG